LFAFRLALFIAAATVLSLLFIRAVSFFDLSWDSLSYHLPYASRLAGLCPETCFRMDPDLELFYRSFPVAAEFLQGLLWRVTNIPEAANLVGFFSLLTLVLYLAVAWKVSFPLAVFGLLAVPMVQIHATVSYVDLPANVAATIALLALAAILLERPLGKGHQFVFVAAVVFLGNSKIQMMPIAGVTAVAYLVLINRFAPENGPGVWRIGRGGNAGVFWGGLLLLLVSATGIRNLLYFGNPVFPVQLSLFGIDLLPGVIAPMAGNSVSTQLAETPRFVRWLLSVSEWAAFEGRSIPYSLDQWTPSQSSPSFRMGGYFAAYVFTTVAMVLWSAARLETRKRRRLLVFLAAMTAGTGLMPASHELRYYMFWMLVLVSLNLHFIGKAGAEAGGDRRLSRIGQVAVLLCFAAVTTITGGHYLEPRTRDVREVVNRRGISQFVTERVKDGDTICVADRSRAFLYADIFHPGRDYHVLQYEDPACDLRVE